MGKNNRHKKFLKQEKAKVKLKAGKKLTKGQNITDTSFKAKKIVLLSQLTAAPEEPQTKKKLNLKDLSSRSRHHNVNMRLEALVGLRELAAAYPEVLLTSLCTFIEICATRCTNEESHLVRQEGLRLLNFILSKVSTVQLEPFISKLILHLSTGMTHLHREVQEDALRMLDVVLSVAPSLVAQVAPVLLPAFLDQISVQRGAGTSERTLSLDLQSSNTSTRWRIKVLGRLHAMLSAAEEYSPSSVTPSQAPTREVHWTPEGSPYVPVSLWQHTAVCHVQGLFTTGANIMCNQNLFKDESEMKKYISILMPLLFETWSEAGPNQKKQRDIGSLIPGEAAELLDCVLETIRHLWNYLESTEKQFGDLGYTKWFRKTYRGDFLTQILAHFPYYTAVGGEKNQGRRSKGQAPFKQEPERSCHSQNLTICFLFCCLCDRPSPEQARLVHMYTLTCLSSGQRVSEQLVRVLRLLLQAASMYEALGLDSNALTNAAVTCCLKPPGLTNPQITPLFELLCDLCIKTACANKLHPTVMPNTSYSRLMVELPRLLTESVDPIPAVGLRTMIKLSAMQDSTLLQAVKQHLPKIAANLTQLRVEGMDQRELTTGVLGVLYQASVWRSDILELAARSLQQAGDPLVLQQFKAMMQIKKEMDPSSVASLKLNLMPWFII